MRTRSTSPGHYSRRSKISVALHQEVENENAANKDPKESSVKDISELMTKYDLDISEMNNTLSRIKLKGYIEKGFEELNARMKKIGYSYEKGSRSFVK